ncbi:MAG: hypothetical protein JW717_12985 [Marinilabiliaceae bacterium]|nr:hypothetical protein [Marinilabiliaceae bacterium]
MITVSQAVESVIKVKPFLAESLSEGIVNISSVARKIHPQIEQIVKKNIKEGAIVMALNRLIPNLNKSLHNNLKNIMGAIGDIIVRSNLSDFTYRNSNTIFKCHTNVMNQIVDHQDIFYTFVRGVFESNLVVSSSFENVVINNFKNEDMIWKSNNLSAITLKLPSNNTQVTGFYYHILKALAWEGINLKEVISTTNEFTILVNDEDIDRGFTILKGMKAESNYV